MPSTLIFFPVPLFPVLPPFSFIALHNFKGFHDKAINGLSRRHAGRCNAEAK
jgi:hypothetical protein